MLIRLLPRMQRNLCYAMLKEVRMHFKIGYRIWRSITSMRVFDNVFRGYLRQVIWKIYWRDSLKWYCTNSYCCFFWQELEMQLISSHLNYRIQSSQNYGERELKYCATSVTEYCYVYKIAVKYKVSVMMGHVITL